MPVARSRTQFRLFDLVMWVVLAALIFASVQEIRLISGRNGGSTGTGMYIAIGFGLWYAVRRIRRLKRTGPVCQECGRRFVPHGQTASSTVCARCRMASLPRARSRREQVRAWVWLLLIVTILMALVGLPGWSRTVERFGGFAWIVFPLLALVATFGLVAAVIFLLVVVSLVRNLRMRFEKPILALARKSARQEGTIERSGPVTIWWCGSTDPGPIVMEQFEVIRKRFEQLIDEPSETPLLRVLVFDTRGAFVAYHRSMLPDMGGLDCLYAGRPGRTITLATEVTRFRLHDQTRSIRSGLALYFLEAYKRFLPPNWLQAGISGFLICEPGDDSRRQRDRRMKAALANGTILSAAELFPQIPARQVFRQIRAQADPVTFARNVQFRGQSWSVLEYLAGPEAPPERLGRFRSFLSELKAAASQEAVFEAPLRPRIRCVAGSMADVGFAAELGQRSDSAAGDPNRNPRKTRARDT